MRILVTGGDGMLGESLNRVFITDKLHITDIEELDVRYWDNVMLYYSPQKYDYIFHFAAETNLERCEKDPAHAYFANDTGTKNMTLLAEKLRIPIVYISTMNVFNGKSPKGYNEWDTPNPINHYGRSKLYGEITVRRYAQHYIFRAGAMFGGGKRDHKFVGQVYNKMCDTIDPIKIIAGNRVSLTYTEDLIRHIKAVIKTGEYGVYHAINAGQASRYTIAKQIKKSMESENYIQKVPPEFFSNDYPCTRPKHQILNARKFLRPWDIALEEYIKGRIRDDSRS